MTRYTEFADLRSDYITRGLVLLHPDQLGVERSVHDEIYAKEIELFRAKEYISAENLPEITQVLEAPGLVEACDILLDEDWAIMPFTHNTPFISGAFDQHWHKDDNGPYNARRPRYHQPVQIEMLYYPQAVAEDMGPTATLPYSQYWTLDSEENQDNFAGADHLDFPYQIEGWESVPVSGKRSRYDPADVVARNTEHDKRMRDAANDLAWPLVEPFEAAPIEAGSVLLYSHNLFHRGNHRRDDWQLWREKPRFMWRFWLYRTKAPKTVSVPLQLSEREKGADENVQAVWRSTHSWWSSEAWEGDRPRIEDLYAMGESAEPVRIGTAYRLAHAGELDVLADALRHNRESVRRASTYGLASAGTRASNIFLDACQAESKWTRKAGAFGLGVAGETSDAVLDVLANLLLEDASTYVRSYAADAMGQFVMRTDDPNLIFKAVASLLRALDQEVNRESMDRVQNRSIKFVRPTDECDICEGIGITLGFDRFEPVRSIVRENALVSLVIATQHDIAQVPGLLDNLERIASDDPNMFSAGLALDALVRIVGDEDKRAVSLVANAETLCWPSLVRAGYSRSLA